MSSRTAHITPLQALAGAGWCTDEWDRWQQGQCGTYAHALIELRPELRLGFAGYLDEENGFFEWKHAFAHDDTYAYDSAGRHLLRYRGIDGNWDYAELDLDPDDYGLPYDESGPEGAGVNLVEDRFHASRNGILDGRYSPDGRAS